MALAAAVVSCSPQGVQARLPVIAGSTKPIKHAESQGIVLAFGTTDPALVPNDYSVATATMISPLITGWSRQNQTVRDGELLSYIHPLLGAIMVVVHVDSSGTVTYSGTMSDNQSRFTAIVKADGTFSSDQILVASLVETVYPPVQSYQMYAHSTFTGTIARDGGYGGNGSAVNLTSTLAYERPPNPDITAPTGTEGYFITFAVKSVPSKSFFGMQFYPWDDGYSDPAAVILSATNSSVYDQEIIAKSHDPRSAYSYMFYWRSGVFYQIPWGRISREDIPDTWDKF
jgi:hypothetical protein